MNTSAKVDTLVNIKPRGSQVYLVGSLVFASICVLASIPLFLAELISGFFLLGTALIVFCAGIWKWGASQSDADSSPSTTSLTLKDGTVLQLESRLIQNPDYVLGISKISKLMLRSPLPIPDGEWKNKTVHPNSKAAIDNAHAVNIATQSAVNGIVDTLNSNSSSTENTPRIQ